MKIMQLSSTAALPPPHLPPILDFNTLDVTLHGHLDFWVLTHILRSCIRLRRLTLIIDSWDEECEGGQQRMTRDMAQTGGTLRELVVRFNKRYTGLVVEDLLKVHDKMLKKVTIEYAHDEMEKEKPIIPKILHCFKDNPLRELHVKVPVLS